MLVITFVTFCSCCIISIEWYVWQPVHSRQQHDMSLLTETTYILICHLRETRVLCCCAVSFFFRFVCGRNSGPCVVPDKMAPHEVKEMPEWGAISHLSASDIHVDCTHTTVTTLFLVLFKLSYSKVSVSACHYNYSCHLDCGSSAFSCICLLYHHLNILCDILSCLSFSSCTSYVSLK